MLTYDPDVVRRSLNFQPEPHTHMAITKPAVDWYFDYISPFAYLQSERLDELRAIADVTPRPVLFAGLLKAHGQLGPAEIPAKRVFTYRHTIWLAERQGIPITYPDGHPFNSLPLLRATLAAQCSWDFVHAAFRFVWQQGQLPDNTDALHKLLADHGLTADALSTQSVKDGLKNGTDAAIEAGVFGVPTAIIGNELFWGTDAFAMLTEYVGNPDLLKTPQMRRVSALPAAARRPGSDR